MKKYFVDYEILTHGQTLFHSIVLSCFGYMLRDKHHCVYHLPFALYVIALLVLITIFYFFIPRLWCTCSSRV